ncbi:zinc ribbon domain-containing protein [Halorarius litoreus]
MRYCPNCAARTTRGTVHGSGLPRDYCPECEWGR